MISSLDEICPDNGFVLQREGSAYKADKAAPVRFVTPRGAITQKRYNVAFSNLTRTEFLDLVVFFEGVGYAVAFEWTPPGEAKEWYQFDQFFASADTGSMGSVECSMVRIPGLPLSGGEVADRDVEVLGTFEGLNLDTGVGEVVFVAANAAVVTSIVFRITAAASVTGPASLTLGVHPSESNLVGPVTMPGLLAAGDAWVIPILGRTKRLNSGATIRIKVTDPASASSLISDLDIVGYRV